MVETHEVLSRVEAAEALGVSAGRVSQLLRAICPVTDAAELESPDALPETGKVGRRLILRGSVEEYMKRHDRTGTRWRERVARRPTPRLHPRVADRPAAIDGSERHASERGFVDLRRARESNRQLRQLLRAALAASDELTMALRANVGPIEDGSEEEN